MSVLSSKRGNEVIVSPQDRPDTNSAPDVEKVLADHIDRQESEW